MKKGVVLVVLMFVLFSFSVFAADDDNDDYCLESVATTYPFTFSASDAMSAISDLKGNNLIYANSGAMTQLMLFNFNTKQSSPIQLTPAFTSNIQSIKFVGNTQNEAVVKFASGNPRIVDITTGNNFEIYNFFVSGLEKEVYKANDNNYYSYYSAEDCGTIGNFCIYREKLNLPFVATRIYTSPTASGNNDYGTNGFLDGGSRPIIFWYFYDGVGYDNYASTIDTKLCIGSSCSKIDITFYDDTGSGQEFFVTKQFSKTKNDVLMLYEQNPDWPYNSYYGIYDLKQQTPNKELTLTDNYVLVSMDITRFIYNTFYKDLTPQTNPYSSATLINNQYLVSPLGYLDYVNPNANSGPAACPLGGNDCDDTLATGTAINPGSSDPCKDCNAATACVIPCIDSDADGYGLTGTDLSGCAGSATTADCDDTNIEANPGISAENSNSGYCTDGIDNDCDTLTDSNDNDCVINCGSYDLSECYDPSTNGQCYWVPGLIFSGTCKDILTEPPSDCSGYTDQTGCTSNLNPLNCEWGTTSTCDEVSPTEGCNFDSVCDAGETYSTCLNDCGCYDTLGSQYPNANGCGGTAEGTCDDDFTCDLDEFCGCSDCDGIPGQGGCKSSYICSIDDADGNGVTDGCVPDNTDYNVPCEDPFCVIDSDTPICVGIGGGITPWEVFDSVELDGTSKTCCATGICADSITNFEGTDIALQGGECVAELGQSEGFVTFTNAQTGEIIDKQPCTLSLGKKIPFYDYLGVFLTLGILVGYYLFRHKRK